MREKKYKVCPRCDKKNSLADDKCSSCGLVFARLQNVSNSAAKMAIKKREFNKVINYNVLPPDVNKWKLFFLALFLGWTGAHYAKVGKYKTFVYMLVSLVLILLIATSIVPISWMSDPYLFLVVFVCYMPASVGVMIWVISTIRILFGKFKVPVAIDENIIKEKINYHAAAEILDSVKKEREEKNKEEKEQRKLNKEKIYVVCASCGAKVKVNKLETICPKCDEPLKGD